MNFNKITSYLDSLESEGIPSVDCLIYKNHEMVYRHFNGYSDGAKTKRLIGNELYLMFSATKLITMTAVMQLVEKKLIDLDSPVSEFLPMYKNLKVQTQDGILPAKNQMLVRHLLSMQSGLDYNLNRPGIIRVLKDKGQRASTLELVNSFVESPLIFEPGEHFEYSLSHDVAGAIVEVVSGMTLGEYFSQNIFRPLEMKDTFFAMPFNENDRLVAQYAYDNLTHKAAEMEKSCCYQLSNCYESGGAGLISSVEDYGRFADTLSCGGISAKGICLLRSETIELMKTNMLGKTQREDFIKKMGRTGYGYGCGVRMLLEPENCSSKAPAGVFGWDGAAGAFIMMDPKNHISIVYAQHVRGCDCAYSTIHPTLLNLLYTE